MKQFLYLDTDIVNSILAQEDQGLIQSFSNEQTTSEIESDELQTSVTVEGTIGGSLFSLAKAEANLTSKFDGSEGNSSSSTSREIISKTLHDAAFNLAYKYIKADVVPAGNEDFCETGCYIELNRVFDFVDFDYLEGLFNAGGLVEYLKKNSAEQIQAAAEQAKEGHNRQELRKAGVNFKNEVKKAINLSDKQFDDIALIIKAMRGLVPYNHVLVSYDGYVIPLDDQYFRVNPSNLGFKYGGEITCVGMVTNIIGEDANPHDDKNIFATIQFTANEALRALLPTKSKNLSVIHPIAIYYGK